MAKLPEPPLTEEAVRQTVKAMRYDHWGLRLDGYTCDTALVLAGWPGQSGN